MNIKNLKQLIFELSFKSYRFNQIIECVFKQKIAHYSQMTYIPSKLRTALIERFGDNVCSIKRINNTFDSQADKVLFSLEDSNAIEAVNLHYKKGWESFCISSQCGCKLGCQFCATGASGYKRSLTLEELTDQLLFFYLNGHKLDSVSFMGMGEPLANENIFEAINILTNPSYFALGQRKLTVSTIGIIDKLEQLTTLFPQVNIAFSLHSPFDAQRSTLMPINKTNPLNEVIKVLDNYINRNGRRVFIAYVLLHGVNDTPLHAKALANLIKSSKAKRHLYHVDLIPYNTTLIASRHFEPTPVYKAKQFLNILKENKISVSTRVQFGSKINAACGQLCAKGK